MPYLRKFLLITFLIIGSHSAMAQEDNGLLNFWSQFGTKTIKSPFQIAERAINVIQTGFGRIIRFTEKYCILRHA